MDLNQNHSRRERIARAGTPEQRVDSVPRVRGSVAPQAAAPQGPPVVVTAQKPQQDVPTQRLPSPDRQMSSTRIERRTITKPAFGTTLENSKPAIALAYPAHSKIVVVSAEQAQRERERLAQSGAQRHRRPAIGLTGKAAFEALFNDGRDTSKTTRH